MLRETSARLAVPLAADALRWHVAETDQEAGRALLEPYAARSALQQRLDEACGAEGWSFTLAPLGTSALVANLTVHGVTRAEVAALDAAAAPTAAALRRLADVAFSRCAAQLGLRLPFVTEHPDYWVDHDPESGEPLFEPAPVPAPVANLDDGRETVDPAPRVPRSEPPSPAATASVVEEAPAEAPAPSNPAHAMIERLIDRLNAEGLGKEAARLVVRYHGFGRTAEESRELYGKLRALLLGSGAEAP